jgi:hypothetical protein
MCIEEMEEGEGASSHDKEVEGQNTRIGNAETESNGCKGRGEQETLLETVKSLKIEVQSYKEDNERLMREKSQINARVLQSLNQLQGQAKNGSKQEEEGRCHERRDDRGRVGYSRSASRAHRHHSPPYSTRKFYASEYSLSSPEVSPVRHQRRRHEVDSLQGELRKLKPPSFDGEREREDDVEAWFLGLRRYFQLHNYSSNLEARISTYHLHGKVAMWWDQLKQVEHINENRITWKQFKKYFQKEYLSEHFYDKKMQEFFELRLGSMTMAEYEKKFLGLLKYVGFINDEKVKYKGF